MSDLKTRCAACGLPGHRYGRNEGMDRYDPMACINQLRGVLEDLLANGQRVVMDRDKIKHCPMCGRLVNRLRYDDEMCLPTNCDAWVVQAKFNHATREWDAIDPTTEEEG